MTSRSPLKQFAAADISSRCRGSHGRPTNTVSRRAAITNPRTLLQTRATLLQNPVSLSQQARGNRFRSAGNDFLRVGKVFQSLGKTSQPAGNASRRSDSHSEPRGILVRLISIHHFRKASGSGAQSLFRRSRVVMCEWQWTIVSRMRRVRISERPFQQPRSDRPTRRRPAPTEWPSASRRDWRRR
jgi:hypothetical protein